MKIKEVEAGIYFVLLLVCSLQLKAQVEVVPLEGNVRVFYFDSISPTSKLETVERKVPDSILQKLKKDEAFWYANAPIQNKVNVKKEKEISISWLTKEWVRTALWFLITALFAAVLVWYLSSLNIRLFRKPSTMIESSINTAITENIFSIQYGFQIADAIKASNFNQAIRLYYLQALYLLSEKGLIQYKQDYTNSVYIRQLYNTPFYKDFFDLTRNFEYTWYGKFEMNASIFSILQKDFETFYSKLPA